MSDIPRSGKPLSHEPSRSHLPESPAEDAFWAIVSFEAKLKATDAAVDRRLQSRHYNQSDLLAEWAKTRKRIGEKSRRRNQLAHGAIFSEGTPDGTRVSFVPFLNQAMAGHQVVAGAPGLEVFFSDPDYPPESDKWDAARIESIAKGFDAGSTRLKHFHYALQAHNRAVSAREAESRRFFEQHRLSQNATNNPSPPQPSEA